LREGRGRYDVCFRSRGVPEACITRKLRYEPEGKYWEARHGEYTGTDAVRRFIEREIVGDVLM
jgi:hypothetical protein